MWAPPALLSCRTDYGSIRNEFSAPMLRQLGNTVKWRLGLYSAADTFLQPEVYRGFSILESS